MKSEPNTQTGLLTREMLESQPTELLLVLLPDYWQLSKDSGVWNIGHMDTDTQDFKHPSMCDHTPRGYLVEFLLQHPYTGEEIEVQRFLMLLRKEGSFYDNHAQVMINVLNDANSQNQTAL